MPRTMSKIKMDGFRAHSSAAISLLFLISRVSEWIVSWRTALDKLSPLSSRIANLVDKFSINRSIYSALAVLAQIAERHSSDLIWSVVSLHDKARAVMQTTRTCFKPFLSLW